jgi:hypothetical protein
MNATGAMWESIFLLQQREKFSPRASLQLSEIGLLGRSVEKILQVDLLPATFYTSEPKDNEVRFPTTPYPTALVSNLFVHASVDLNALL